MLGSFDALLLEVDEVVVPLFGKAEERWTGDEHLWIREARAHVFLEFCLSRHKGPAFLVVDHDAVSSSIGSLVGG
jgi:hypothetical protein